MPTLQEQVNSASSGDTIQHDGEFTGNLIIPKPLTIQGKGRIVTPNAEPPVTIPPATGPVVLKGLEITTGGQWPEVHDLIRWGDGGPAQDTLAKVPQGLTIDTCDIHGQPGQPSQRGISANGANLRVVNSKIREIHWKGFDTQAICAWNGPGPFLIEDTYLEAAGENVMFGGSMVTIPNLVPSDITIRRCQFFKPLSWKGVYTVKNLLELKNAQRVLVEDSSFENCWIDGQDGYAWVFTVRGEAGGRNPWNIVTDVTMRNCRVRGANRGIQTLGRDDLDIAQPAHGLRISNCLFEDIQDWFFVLSVFDDIAIEHVTHHQGGNNIVFTGGVSRNFAYVNNATQYSGYGFKADGGGEGSSALAQYCPGARFEGNVIAGAPATLYPPANYYPVVYPVDLSAYQGTDGLVPGFAGDSTTPPQPPLPEPTPPDKTESVDGTKGTKIVDSQLVEWTIGKAPDFLAFQNGIYKGGAGTIYKYLSKVVYILGLDNWWWKWIEGTWEKYSEVEPGTEPPPPPLRTVPWPRQQAKQNSLLEAQWTERYRLKKLASGNAEFEKVP